MSLYTDIAALSERLTRLEKEFAVHERMVGEKLGWRQRDELPIIESRQPVHELANSQWFFVGVSRQGKVSVYQDDKGLFHLVRSREHG